MKWTILSLISTAALAASIQAKDTSIKQFVRFQYQGEARYGQLKNDQIYPVNGDVFTHYTLSESPISLHDTQLLLPTTPEKIFAVGMNFASHLSSPSNQPPPLFLKLPSSLILSGERINVPEGATNVHFEGEMVIVIGKRARNITPQQVDDVVFGVTVGNDLTERNWQGQDLQWMRAKAADGFAPIASTITQGVDYHNLMLTTRLNGKIVQQETTANMIHSVDKVVSYLSQYFTLKPGDLIYMGTPGRTQALRQGDTVTVSIDGVGQVENRLDF